MAEHPNVTAVRRMLDAFNDGDVETMREGLAPDVKWHMIGGNTAESRDELEQMTMESMGDFSITGEVHDVIGNDEHVVALVEATARAGDESFVYRTAEIMHVRDGVITERWAFSDDTAAINDFFSRFE